MTVQYSLKEFYEAGAKLAKLNDKTQNYVIVSAEINSEGETKFRLYIHEFGSFIERTPEECLRLMKEKIVPTETMPIDKDIKVEVEIQDEKPLL
jgi:hypothetical protein